MWLYIYRYCFHIPKRFLEFVSTFQSKNYKIFNLKIFRYKSIHPMIYIFESRLNRMYILRVHLSNIAFSHLALRIFYSIKHYNKSYIYIRLLNLFLMFKLPIIFFSHILLLKHFSHKLTSIQQELTTSR